MFSFLLESYGAFLLCTTAKVGNARLPTYGPYHQMLPTCMNCVMFALSGRARSLQRNIKYNIILNKGGVKLCYYRVWTRDVFWLGFDSKTTSRIRTLRHFDVYFWIDGPLDEALAASLRETDLWSRSRSVVNTH